MSLISLNNADTIKLPKLNKTTPNFFHNFNLSFEKRNIKRKLNIIKKDNYKKKNNKNKSLAKPINKIKKDIITTSKCISSRNNLIKMNKSKNNKKVIIKKKRISNIIKDFLAKLANNNQSREEKMIKLNEKNEEKINSIYTFSPKLMPNKNNQKYYKKFMDKIFINNIKDNINNKILNNTQISNNYQDLNNNENQSQLDIVLEENRKNINYSFISRLNEYEKRKSDNLEKIKNEIYLNENQKREIYNNNDKYYIEDYHLLNSTYSYFFNKKRNIDKLTKDIDDEKGITFRPKLNNEYNLKIIKNYNNIKNEKYINKKNKRIFDYLSNKDKECTFHPKINNIYNTNELNVSERLFRYQNKYKEKLDLMRTKYCNFTFKPKISKNTNIILNKKKLIQNLKEQIKENASESNKELLNKIDENDINKITEKKNDDENNDNDLENNKINSQEAIKEAEDEKISPVIINNLDDYNENKENKNMGNNYYKNNMLHSNDFKTFINSNSTKNKNSNLNNNKKIMDFDYYNNILLLNKK